jgi:hypothetical protein
MPNLKTSRDPSLAQGCVGLKGLLAELKRQDSKDAQAELAS